MTHEVILAAQAQRELDAAHDWWATNRSREQADRWYARFVDALIELESNPDRFPLASENDLFAFELRQLNFGIGRRPSHRAIFAIHDRTVIVLRVRSVHQAPISPE